MKKLFFLIFSFLLLYGNGVDVSSHSSHGRLIANGYATGIEYYCGNTKMGETNQGYFETDCDSDIIFKIGSVTIGKLNLNGKTQKIFYLPEILGYEKTDTNKNNVIRLMQLLQTLDSYSNGDPRDGIIEINSTILKNIDSTKIDFTEHNITEGDLNGTRGILKDANISSNKLISSIKAQNFLERYYKDIGIDVEHIKPFKPELITSSTHPYIYILKTNYDNYIATRNDGQSDNFKISIFGEKGDKVYLNNQLQGYIKDDWTFYVSLTHNWQKFNEYNITLEDENGNKSETLDLKIYKVASNPIILNTTFSCNNTSFDLNISDYDLLRAYDELNLTIPPHTIKIDNKIAKINSFQINKFQGDFNITSYYVLYNIDCSDINSLSNHNLKVIQNKTFNGFIKEITIP